MKSLWKYFGKEKSPRIVIFIYSLYFLARMASLPDELLYIIFSPLTRSFDRRDIYSSLLTTKSWNNYLTINKDIFFKSTYFWQDETIGSFGEIEFTLYLLELSFQTPNSGLFTYDENADIKTFGMYNTFTLTYEFCHLTGKWTMDDGFNLLGEGTLVHCVLDELDYGPPKANGRPFKFERNLFGLSLKPRVEPSDSPFLSSFATQDCFTEQYELDDSAYRCWSRMKLLNPQAKTFLDAWK